jgi:hypothetical protein
MLLDLSPGGLRGAISETFNKILKKESDRPEGGGCGYGLKRLFLGGVNGVILLIAWSAWLYGNPAVVD